MTRSRIAILAGVLGALAAFPMGTTSFAGGAGVGSFGHMSPVSMGGAVAPIIEPRYNLGPGNTAEPNADSCVQNCLATTAGPVRRVQQSCRRTCASHAF